MSALFDVLKCRFVYTVIEGTMVEKKVRGRKSLVYVQTVESVKKLAENKPG